LGRGNTKGENPKKLNSHLPHPKQQPPAPLPLFADISLLPQLVTAGHSPAPSPLITVPSPQPQPPHTQTSLPFTDNTHRFHISQDQHSFSFLLPQPSQKQTKQPLLIFSLLPQQPLSVTLYSADKRDIAPSPLVLIFLFPRRSPSSSPLSQPACLSSSPVHHSSAVRHSSPVSLPAASHTWRNPQ
jgi:hypothetical protein